jgi:hypothetical protein
MAVSCFIYATTIVHAIRTVVETMFSTGGSNAAVAEDTLGEETKGSATDQAAALQGSLICAGAGLADPIVRLEPPALGRLCR